MKAATGELSLTLVAVVAIGAVLALFTSVVLPKITKKLEDDDMWNMNEKISETVQCYDYEILENFNI